MEWEKVAGFPIIAGLNGIRERLNWAFKQTKAIIFVIFLCPEHHTSRQESSTDLFYERKMRCQWPIWIMAPLERKLAWSRAPERSELRPRTYTCQWAIHHKKEEFAQVNPDAYWSLSNLGRRNWPRNCRFRLPTSNNRIQVPSSQNSSYAEIVVVNDCTERPSPCAVLVQPGDHLMVALSNHEVQRCLSLIQTHRGLSTPSSKTPLQYIRNVQYIKNAPFNTSYTLWFKYFAVLRVE